MMAKQLFIFWLFATVCIRVSAQSILTGTVTESGTKELLPVVNVALYKNGVLKASTQTDFDGIYRITELDPGTYDVEFSLIGSKKLRQMKRLVAGESCYLNAELEPDLIGTACVFAERIPIVKIDQTACGHECVSKATVVDSIGLSRRTGIVNKEDGSSRSNVYGIPFFNHNAMPKSVLENGIQKGSEDSVATSEMRLNIQLSPNPATFMVSLELKKEMESLHVTNAQGQLMGNWTNLKAGTLQIEVNTWTNGVYFATFKQGNAVWTEKFSVIH